MLEQKQETFHKFTNKLYKINVGKINKIWVRVEFQSTAGNLPHNHKMLWVEPGTYDPEKLIQCSEKLKFFQFREIFESEKKTRLILL